jgi:tripartite motif-containing protein 56
MLHNVTKEVTKITECSVCAETYRDPRVLPCIHTYCLKCINGFSARKRPGDSVSCPLCRKDFTVPENGLGGLPKNFFIEQLKDLTQTQNAQCGGCDASRAKRVTTYCVECHQKLCEGCSNSHRRIRSTQGHTLVDIGDDGKIPESVGKWLTQHCDEHPTKAFEVYCFECNQVICLTCVC